MYMFVTMHNIFKQGLYAMHWVSFIYLSICSYANSILSFYFTAKKGLFPRNILRGFHTGKKWSGWFSQRKVMQGNRRNGRNWMTKEAAYQEEKHINTEAPNKAVYTLLVMSLFGAAWKAFCNAKSRRETLSSNMVPPPSSNPRRLFVTSGGACVPNFR